MEQAMPWIAAAVVVLIAARRLFAAVRRYRALRRAYRHVAERYDGEYLGGGLFGRPVVRFVHQDAGVLVDAHAGDNYLNRQSLRLRIAWPDPQFRCTIAPHTFRSRVEQFFLGPALPSASAAFGRRFTVQSTATEMLRDTITDSVQSGMLRLQQLGAGSEVFAEFGDGWFTVRVRGVIRDPLLLERFTAMGLEVYDQALLSRTAGIEILGRRMEAHEGEAVCPVCGEAIFADVVYCRSCATPHHAECWRYVSGCATYACGEIRYRGEGAPHAATAASWRPHKPR